MTPKTRLIVFLFAALILSLLYLRTLRSLPQLDSPLDPYGTLINQVGTYERHVTEMVGAVNFDYRAIDTLGEELILFFSIGGCVMLLKEIQEHPNGGKQSGNKKDGSVRHDIPNPSDASRGFALLLVGPLVLFGFYIVTHGHLTPGGGFQGGVVIATAFLLVYVAGDFKTFKEITSSSFVEIAEAGALLFFLGVGFAGLAFSKAIFENVLPLGTTGKLFSGGMIPVLNVLTGLAVGTGLITLIYAFLEQTLAKEAGEK